MADDTAPLPVAVEDQRVRVSARFRPGDDYRPIVRLVTSTAETMDPPLDEERVQDLRLAVTEACANAVEAQQAAGVDDTIAVTCIVGEARLHVDVRDHGPGFHPDDVPELPEPDDVARLDHESGLGVHLIRTLSDHSGINGDDDGTLVSMTFASRHAPTPPR